ncbi:MAG: hypothetical protein U9R15_06610 [Chloroflexota bacterium]|nr:hypothetical protein [Chloroflexota bacterium]
MSLQTKVTQTTNAAILCRKHPVYLEHAAQIGAETPAQPITFRTSEVWRSGQVAVDTHGPRVIYFTPAGERLVEYEALLEKVVLYPKPDTRATKELLKNCLPETRDQGLWEQYDEPVQTLYVISHCHRRLASSFPFTKLTKLSDGLPIDESYSAGYALVYEYCTKCKNSPCRCS